MISSTVPTPAWRDVMPKHRDTAKWSDEIWIERELLRSEAWRGLTRTAKNVLSDFWLRRQMAQDKTPKHGLRWVIQNNGHIEYPYSEAEEKGIPRASFQRAIDELIEKGFLSVARTGSGVRCAATLYSLDDRWKQYGTPEFKVRKRPRKKRWARHIGFQKGHLPHRPKKALGLSPPS